VVVGGGRGGRPGEKIKGRFARDTDADADDKEPMFPAAMLLADAGFFSIQV
jgi:hypothetical protein